MKSRNELAETILVAMNRAERSKGAGSEWLVELAFRQADAFLAAAGEQPRQEREPDAVWTLSVDGSNDVTLAARDGTPLGHFMSFDPYRCVIDRLRRGKDSVRLRVYVEEVE